MIATLEAYSQICSISSDRDEKKRARSEKIDDHLAVQPRLSDGQVYCLAEQLKK